MKNLYVSFNDSLRDPTYASAEDCNLVGRNTDSGDDENPCVGKNGKSFLSTPLIPETRSEIRRFATLMGWDVQTDNEGQLILYTGKK